MIDFSHGVSIYERCPTSVEPLWIAGAGHNDGMLTFNSDTIYTIAYRMGGNKCCIFSLLNQKNIPAQFLRIIGVGGKGGRKGMKTYELFIFNKKKVDFS